MFYTGLANENRVVLTQLKTLIERFANSTSSDDFFDALNNIYRDADKDPELKGWFKHIDAFVRYVKSNICKGMHRF